MTQSDSAEISQTSALGPARDLHQAQLSTHALSFEVKGCSWQLLNRTQFNTEF